MCLFTIAAFFLIVLFVAYPALGVLGLILLALIIFKSRSNHQEIMSENKVNADQALKNFDLDITKHVGDYAFLLSQGYKELAIRYDGSSYVQAPIILSMDNISKLELLQDNSVVKESGIGRAVAGSIFAGGAGAIVGSDTAKQVTQIEDITVKITTKDINNPIIRLQVYSQFDKYRFSPQNIHNQADELIAILDIVKSED